MVPTIAARLLLLQIHVIPVILNPKAAQIFHTREGNRSTAYVIQARHPVVLAPVCATQLAEGRYMRYHVDEKHKILCAMLCFVVPLYRFVRLFNPNRFDFW